MNICNEKLRYVDFPSILENCSGKLCSIQEHKDFIDNMYRNVVDIMCEAAALTYRNNCRKKKPLAGWNAHVGEAHRNARLMFDVWVLCGKPLTGKAYDDMVASRKCFKGRL